MEQSVKTLRGARIIASDGPIGTVDDLLFDDESWVARYLVVDTGGWLTGRRVLVSPLSFRHVDWREQSVEIVLTRAQLEGSPELPLDAPVTRADEVQYFGYYGYEPYWAGMAPRGLGMYPTAAGPPVLGAEKPEEFEPRRAAAEDLDGRAVQPNHTNPHLRSAKELTGYHIQALDGELGHIRDFLLDRGTLRIQSIVVDTSNWWMGKHVVLPASAIVEVDWDERTALVRLTRDAIEQGPELHDRKSA